jgi:hypothetical protein
MKKQSTSDNQYKSKYYDIDAYYENSAKEDGWEKEDFIWILKILESLPQEKLIKLCEHPEIDIKTSGGWGGWDEEQLIAVLISDVHPDTLLNVIKKVIIEKSE